MPADTSRTGGPVSQEVREPSAEERTLPSDTSTAQDEAGRAEAGGGERPADDGTSAGRGRRARSFARQPLALLGLAVLLTVGLGFATTHLQTAASASLLMDSNSASYRQQTQFAGLFGADPVVVLAQPARSAQLLSPSHMVGLAQMEGQLSRLPGVQRVYGPGTLVNTFATVVTQRALALCTTEGQAAQKQAVAAATRKKEPQSAQNSAGSNAFTAAVTACAKGLAARYPSLSMPALNNPAFYGQLLLEPNGSVRPFWQAVLPSASRALITIRMDQNASLSDVQAAQRYAADAASGRKSQTVTAATGQRMQVPTMAGDLQGLRFTVSGTPALMASLAASTRDSLKWLLPAALVAMLALTFLVLRVRFRLLAVLLAALAGVWTAGAAALLHLPLTPATLVVLPVVLGLAADYLLQNVNRLAEEEGPPAQRFGRMTKAILPATGVAAAATAAGVLAFAASGVPLVRQFGVFLALGVAMAWLTNLLVGIPLLWVLVRRTRPRPRRVPNWGWLTLPTRIPALGLLPVVLAGLVGWAALSAIRIQTNPDQLLAPGSPAAVSADSVARQVGYAGELDLVVTAPNVLRPDVVAWMGVIQQDLEGKDLHAVNGLPGFLLAFNYGKAPSQQTAQIIVSRLPRYFTQSVISPDDHTALITFGQRTVMSLGQDTNLIDRINRVTAHPPAGARAYPAGLAVVAASALQALVGNQVLLNLLALGVVLVVLLVAFRRLAPALLAVLPTVVAAGWATGAEYVLGVQATPITILLSGVVVAFATEFSVLWLSRYRSERMSGGSPQTAAEVASRRVGPAIVAAALTLIAGFAALTLSAVPMVSSFGIWCAADLALAALAVLLVLPTLAPRLARWDHQPLRRPSSPVNSQSAAAG